MASKTHRRKSRAPAAPPKRAGARKAAAAPVRIARVAKGKKPQYFADPATDKLLWISISLMQELSVTRDRLDSIERLLDNRKVLSIGDIEKFKPTGAAAAQRNASRATYIERVLRAVQADLEGVAATANADDPVAAVTA